MTDLIGGAGKRAARAPYKASKKLTTNIFTMKKATEKFAETDNFQHSKRLIPESRSFSQHSLHGVLSFSSNCYGESLKFH
jgi:hypothetical protein